MILNGQRPYSQVEEEFYAEAPAAATSAAATQPLLALNTRNDVVLAKLHGFIVEMLRPDGGLAADQPEGGLRDFLYAYLEMRGEEEDEVSGLVCNNVREELRNKHAIALMSHLVRRAHQKNY